MDRPDFQLSCEVSFEAGACPLDEHAVQLLVAASLFEAGAGGGEQVEVSVAFCDEDRIAAINAEHRGVEGPTDVLSFPIDGLLEPVGAGEPRVLGDLLVCQSYVEQQLVDGTTMQDDVDLAAALERCVVHGTLHLCGFDHERSELDAAEIVGLEQLVLDRVRSRSGS